MPASIPRWADVCAHLARVSLFAAVLLGPTGCGSDSPTDEGAPSLSLSSAVADLAGFDGGPNPSTDIDVTNGGSGSLMGLAASIDYEAGQPTGWLSAALSATTAPATLDIEADIEGLAVGQYDATVEVSANGGGGSETIAVTLLLDLSSPPVIEITSPTRAAMLQEGTNAASDIQITGTACHDSVPIEVLTVNGQDIAVSGSNLCEPFDVTQSSEWGLSVIEVHAENAYGRAADVVQSYLRSPEYFPDVYAPDPAARVEHGIFARMNQSLIDDGNRSDFDDIGTVVEARIDAYDLNTGLATTSADPSNAGTLTSENCVVYTNSYRRTGVRLTRLGTLSSGTRAATLLASSDGLSISASVDDIDSRVRAQAWAHVTCLPSITLAQEGDLAIGSVAATVTVNPVEVGGAVVTANVMPVSTVQNLSVDVDWGVFDFLDFSINGIVSLFSDVIESGLESGFNDWLNVTVPDIVESVLESFQVDGARQVSGSILNYEGPIDYLEFEDWYGELGLGIQVRPGGSPTKVAPFGAIRVGGSTPSFSTGYDLGIGVADDHVNQLLWALWQDGSFDIADVANYTASSYPGLEGGVSASLPPVVTTSSGAHHMDVQWGDLTFTGFAWPSEFGLDGFQSGDSVAVEAHVTVIAGVDVAYDTGSEVLTGTVGTPDVRVEVHADAGALLDEAALADVIAQAVADLVVTSLPEALGGVQLPVLDLSGQVGVPAGTVIRLEQATVERDGRYTKLTGSVSN